MAATNLVIVAADRVEEQRFSVARPIERRQEDLCDGNFDEGFKLASTRMNSSALHPTKDHGPAEDFSALWQKPGHHPDIFAFLANHSELSAEETADICIIDQVKRWQAGNEILAEHYFDRIETVAAKTQLKLRLIQNEFDCRCERGLDPHIDSFVSRFPGLDGILRVHLQVKDQPTITPSPDIQSDALSFTVLEKANVTPVEASDLVTAPDVGRPQPYKPEFIGRYKVLSVLGDGGFGRVYLAHDDVLDRQVAIKIAHRHLVSRSSDVESYLTEARIVSKLDHHSIVPVFDCGHTEDGLCFVVSKYIDGSDLASKIKRSPLSNSAAADLVATLAEALHFAHIKGVVHRDVKPANILLDSQGRPYLADFGIALREEDFGTGFTRLGTIAYMSPEQLRGEGHLVDGRSDIFSLGVVLFELLTGRRPFSNNRLEQTKAIEPRPLRRFDDTISKDLERICLKAMSYRVVDRYDTALDMAADLQWFLQLGTASEGPPPRAVGLSGQQGGTTSGNQATATAIQIVPKGLRSFDRDDAGFFLELLPGPRDRNGLPESVRFWKTRIQTPESEPFRVGVIYGPSGCGKSSFLKAGVLPLLSSDIIPVYVESTPSETESRLLRALRKVCPDLSPNLGLVESMTMLRRQRSGTSGRRLLIVIDQFEQWLHSRSKDGSGDLLNALRQCDGKNLQCIITVRDDFWMAVTQFMNELEVSLVPGENLGSVDLFNLRHAKRVLTAIGQAYRILPANAQEIGKEHHSFISKAVAELAHNDQVIPVQLALFAEMIKDKAWTTATLKSAGGAEGVGVTFLEETFNGRAAPPHHRLHQKAARSVLQALLSESPSGIKGAMRSYQELLEVSGYAENPREFDSLLRILDSELRLITPTDPDELGTGRTGPAPSNDADRYYHLTHDYLVPSLQEWLTRKRKETRRGRAELLLADRASMWNRHSSERSLPSFFEWISILLFAGRHSRQENRRLMIAAARYYGSRVLAGGFLLALVIWGTRQQIHHARAVALVESLRSARGDDLINIIGRLEPYRREIDSLLRDSVHSATTYAERLHAGMALIPVDPEQETVVFEGLLGASSDDFEAIRDSLMKWGSRSAITKRLWTELLDPRNEKNPGRRFRAGAALATFEAPFDDSSMENWNQVGEFLAKELVAEIRANLGYIDQWVSALRPVRGVLYPQLDRLFSNSEASEIDRFAAATILADFAQDQPENLANLAVRSPAKEYPVMIARLKKLGHAGKHALESELNSSIPTTALPIEQDRIKKRRAHAAVALLEFDVTEPLLSILSEQVVNPISATYAEDRLSKLGTHSPLLLKLIQREDNTSRASLLRSLAGTSSDHFSQDFRDEVVRLIIKLFKADPDPGVHSAAEWALRSWGLKEEVIQLTDELAKEGPENSRDWYVNRRGHTMIIFKKPIVVQLGSPDEEPSRDSDETLRTRRIDRDFSLSSTEVTVEQFRKAVPKFRHLTKTDTAPWPECPIMYMTWYRAAEYCNWLSDQEGIPRDQWCYRQCENFVKTTKSPSGELMPAMRPEADYLLRTGYRLPTEAEWEFACRAGTTAAYSWGSDPQASERFTRTILNSNGHSWPVGSLCPNRFGLFDMHGNAAEWVHDGYSEKPAESGIDTEETAVEFPDDAERVVRGGHSQELVAYQRSANRTRAMARNGVNSRVGFRVARTHYLTPAIR